MNVIINSEPLFEDIRDSKARKNFDEMIGYLCCKPFPEIRPKMTKIPTGSFEENHEYVASILYSKDNRDLANDILKNRSEITDDKDHDELAVSGFAWIYDLSRKKILRLYSIKYFESISVCEHELTHLIQAVNNNNPKIQYHEFLSLFGEAVTAELLSEKYGNSDIYKNYMIRKVFERSQRRVYATEFEDESLKKQSDIFKATNIELYPYMLGYICYKIIGYISFITK